MTIEEIKAIPITAFLARMGYEPARRRGDEYWYLAPYREERTASFQVNVRKEIRRSVPKLVSFETAGNRKEDP